MCDGKVIRLAMKSAQEIEIKFSVPADLLPKLQRQLSAKPVHAGRPKTLVSVYFDTNKLKLHKRGLSLRVRRNGKRRVQTVKADDGQPLGTRAEWERAIASDVPQPQAARGTPVEKMLRKKKLRNAIKPVFETRVTRTTYPIKAGDSLIEIAVDRGEIDAADASAALSEVELELKRGMPADLFRLAKSIAHQAPLELSFASKAERGYRLVAGEELAPVKAAPVALAPALTVREAFQAIARACLRQLVENVPVLRQGDPEGLHQARVALRRLRAAVSLFGDVLGDPQTGTIKRELKWITNELAPARDMDVLTARAERTGEQAPLSGTDESIGVPALSKQLEQKRRRAFRRARAALASTRFRVLLIDLAGWIEIGEWLTAKDPRLELEGKRPIAQFASEQLERRRKKILKRGRKLRELDPLRRHKLRIQVKKTRYAAEFFVGAFPGRKAQRRCKQLIEGLEPLQDCLGELNDIAVERKLTAKLATQHPQTRRRGGGNETAFAAGELTGRDQARLESLLASAEESFDGFARAKPYW